MENNHPDGMDAGSKITERLREIIGDDPEKLASVKKIFQSEADRRVQAGVDRFRSETLPQHVAKEIEQLNARRPEEILSVKERALEVSARLGMDYKSVAQILLGEGDVDERINSFEELVHDAQISYTEEKLKLHGVNPPPSPGTWNGAFNRADLARMTPAQISQAVASGRLNNVLGRK